MRRFRTRLSEQPALEVQRVARVDVRVDEEEFWNALPGVKPCVALMRLPVHWARAVSPFSWVRKDEQLDEIPSGMSGLLACKPRGSVLHSSAVTSKITHESDGRKGESGCNNGISHRICRKRVDGGERT